MVRFAIFVCACLILSCGATAGVAHAAAGGRAHHVVAPLGKGWMARDAKPKHAWVYVASFLGSENAITIYDMDKTGFRTIGKITKGLDGPNGIALDSQGNLYVPNIHGGNVMIFAPRSTRPMLTLTQGLNDPASVAVDVSGNVYVLNRGGSGSDIVVYPAGQTTPSETIRSGLIQVPSQCFFDAAGDLYVSDRSTGIYVIPAGSGEPMSLKLHKLSGPSGLALDPLNGNLFVGNLNGNAQQSSVAVYRAGKLRLAYTLPNTPFSDFLGLAVFRGHEYVMVSASQGNTVTFFRHERRQPSFVLQSSEEQLYGVAFKPAGMP